jgi:hypothetical protein
MSQTDPWERAADCARAMKLTTDAHQREVFSNLQKLWVALGNEQAIIDDAEVAKEAEAMGMLHVEGPVVAGADFMRAVGDCVKVLVR